MAPDVVMEDFGWFEISGVPRPMQEPAKVKIIKSDQDADGVSVGHGDNLPAAAMPDVVKGKGDETMETQAGAAGAEVSPESLETVKAKLAEMEKAQASTFALASLPAAQRAHYDGLDAGAQLGFLGKTADERAAILDAVEKAKSDPDPVEYTDNAGLEYRKSAGDHVISLAKRADAEQNHRIGLQAVNERFALLKEAEDEFSNLPGEPDTLADLLGVVKTIEDDARREKVMSVLKAHNQNMAMNWVEGGRRQGLAKASDSLLPAGEAELNALRDKIMTDNPGMKKGEAFAKALETPQGQEYFLQTREHYK